MHNDLQKLGFCEEYQISQDIYANKKLVESVPTNSGVYVVLADKNIPRLVGESNVLYIGRGSNLRQRIIDLLKYYLPKNYTDKARKHTAREALGRIIEDTDITPSISYVACTNHKDLETRLIQSYCKQHIETPPLNNQRR